jgi:hypothetical protein
MYILGDLSPKTTQKQDYRIDRIKMNPVNPENPENPATCAF